MIDSTFSHIACYVRTARRYLQIFIANLNSTLAFCQLYSTVFHFHCIHCHLFAPVIYNTIERMVYLNASFWCLILLRSSFLSNSTVFHSRFSLNGLLFDAKTKARSIHFTDTISIAQLVLVLSFTIID